MKDSLRKKYKAQGFVESLIAIMIGGIASVILMTIAANTMSELVKNEQVDILTQVAVEGGEMARRIGDLQKASPTASLFPSTSISTGKCYAISGSLQDPTFPKDVSGFLSACSYDISGGRDTCVANAMITGSPTPKYDNNVFRVFCITDKSDFSKGLIVGKVVTGLKNCKRVKGTNDCEVKDYQYYVFITIK